MPITCWSNISKVQKHFQEKNHSENHYNLSPNLHFRTCFTLEHAYAMNIYKLYVIVSMIILN